MVQNKHAGACTTGFTLLELMVSLSVGSLVIATAATLLFGLRDVATQVDRVSTQAAHNTNARRVFRGLLANVDVGQREPVQGSSDEVRIDTHCRFRTLWLVACRARLRVAPASDGVRVSATLELLEADPADQFQGGLTKADSVTLTLWEGLSRAKFIYLVDAARGGTWAEAWNAQSAPRGLGVVMDNDTLFATAWGTL